MKRSSDDYPYRDDDTPTVNLSKSVQCARTGHKKTLKEFRGKNGAQEMRMVCACAKKCDPWRIENK